jgi:hypothetical protein
MEGDISSSRIAPQKPILERVCGQMRRWLLTVQLEFLLHWFGEFTWSQNAAFPLEIFWTFFGKAANSIIKIKFVIYCEVDESKFSFKNDDI